MSSPPILTPASAHPVLDAITQQFVEARQDRHPGPLRTRPLERVRRAFADEQAPQDALPEVETTDLLLELTDGRTAAIRIVRPPGEQAPLPFVFYLHGGGWVSGGPDTHDRLARRLATGAHAAVVLLDYPLAPEARHPAQQALAQAAMVAVRSQAASLALDPGRIAVAGDGAGGALAAALVLAAVEREDRAICAQVLFCPVTAPVGEDHAYPVFAEGVGPSADDLRCQQEALLGPTSAPDAFVLNAPLRRLAAVPATLLVTAEVDLLRDQGEAYGRKLMRAGAPVAMMRVGGAVADFMVLEALRDTPGARLAVLAAVDLLSSAFGSSP